MSQVNHALEQPHAEAAGKADAKRGPAEHEGLGRLQAVKPLG